MENLALNLKYTSPPIQKTFTLLPAYNEAAALSKLIPRISQKLKAASRNFEILVVNDGSSDQTSHVLASLAEEYAVRELCHDSNRGYGAALKTGFSWIAQHGTPADAAVTLDADNTQDPAYIPALLKKLEEGHDAATASYTMPGGRATGLPWLRRVMSSGVNSLFRLSYRWEGIETYTNGFRAYRVSALRRVSERYGSRLIEESGFPGGTEFFLKVAGSGGKAGQIPFELHYEARGQGSKIRFIATIRRYLRLLVLGHRYVLS